MGLFVRNSLRYDPMALLGLLAADGVVSSDRPFVGFSDLVVMPCTAR
jgi:hypothetical protein